MSRASRHEKAETNLHALKREFEELLLEALHSCANGRWGLLGQYPQRYRLKESEQLEALGEKIDALRKELAIVEEFWFYARFQYYCSIQGSNAVGEPKLAKQFLEDIEQRALEQRNKINSTQPPPT